MRAEPTAAPADEQGRGLHCFAGDQARAESVSGWAHVLGGVVADVDTGTGGAAHNLLRSSTRARLRRRIARRDFDFGLFGGPCATFSPLHRPRLRHRLDPRGSKCPAEWRAHVERANALWDATAELALELWLAGGEFVVEYPQRRYVRGRRAYWREEADAGTVCPGDLPSILELERRTGARRVDLAQCACGGPFQKFTTLLASPRLAERLEWLGLLRCARCDAYLEHDERAVGLFPDGSSRAAASAAYPSVMCRGLAEAGLACRLLPRRGPASMGTGPTGGGSWRLCTFLEK